LPGKPRGPIKEQKNHWLAGTIVAILKGSESLPQMVGRSGRLIGPNSLFSDADLFQSVKSAGSASPKMPGQKKYPSHQKKFVMFLIDACQLADRKT